jgi:hypothetical protein
MKFKALSNVKHDGVFYKKGRELEIDTDDRKMKVAVKSLISDGIIEEVKNVKAKEQGQVDKK